MNPDFDLPFALDRIEALNIPERARINSLSGGQRSLNATSICAAISGISNSKNTRRMRNEQRAYHDLCYAVGFHAPANGSSPLLRI
jgi:hypothetical protein